MTGEKIKIVGLLAIIAEQTGEDVSPARADFVVDRLLKLDHRLVILALERILESSRRFPTVQEVRQMIKDFAWQDGPDLMELYRRDKEASGG